MLEILELLQHPNSSIQTFDVQHPNSEFQHPNSKIQHPKFGCWSPSVRLWNEGKASKNHIKVAPSPRTKKCRILYLLDFLESGRVLHYCSELKLAD